MNDIMDFAGKTALITGAASGIGAAVARWLDGRGVAHLILVDRDGHGLRGLGLSCKTDCHEADVADPAFWQKLEPELDGLDCALANAGIGASGLMAEQSFADWRRVMDVNLDGAFLTMSTAIRAMRASGGGSIVVTSSVTGVKPVPGIGAYGVAKAGVAHMARIAAAEVAKDNIRVNAIAPGGVDTAIWDSGEEFRKNVAAYGRDAVLKQMAATTPRGQFATPDELAGEIGFLLSDLSANITGSVLVSDGGYSL